MRTAHLCLVLLVSLPVVALGDTRVAKGTIQVTSSAFKQGAAIPADFTCDGENRSPPLAWSNVPSQARSIAILVDDPDARPHTVSHWLVTDVSPSQTSLPAGQPGYRGPCPTAGKHHYRIRVFALDIELPRSIGRPEFLSAINGHVLADGELDATYAR